MARIVVGGLHVLIGSLFWWGVVLWAAQIGVNATWEKGFYGEISVLTSAAAVAMIVVAAVATTEIGSAVGWMLGRPSAGLVLTGVSILLGLVLPGPIRLLLWMSAFSIAVELWVRARALAPPVEDEPE